MPIALEYDTDDVAVRRIMDETAAAIEAMAAVRKLSQLPGTGTTRAGFQATLWCYAARDSGACGKKVEPAVQLSSKRTTLLECLTLLKYHL